MCVEALIKWNKWFCDWGEYMEDFHIKLMKKFGRYFYEEEYGSSEYEESEEDSEEE